MTNGHYTCRVRRKIHREDILSAGLELMFLNGYSATGIKDITDKINIPKGSFYNHFNSKEDFGLEVVQNYCDNGAKMYEERFLNSPLPPLKRFECFFDMLIQNYKDVLNCKLGCVMSNFAAEMADVNENFRTLLDTEFDKCQLIMAQCIQQAKENGEIGSKQDSDELAAFTLNGLHGAFIRMKATGSVEPLETFKNLTLTMILT